MVGGVQTVPNNHLHNSTSPTGAPPETNIIKILETRN